MRVAVTGGTGLVGRFIVNGLLDAGHEVVVMTRNPPAAGFFWGEVAHLPYDLDAAVPDLTGLNGIVHAAFDHVPGRYRGGEGDDPEGFAALNRDASLRLFEQARAAGVAPLPVRQRQAPDPSA